MKFPKNLNNLNNLIYLYLFIFIFLFCYTFYRAEFIHNGEQLNYYYKYYLIFLLNVIFWFSVLFFLNNKKKKLILILASSLIFIFYFYETVRFFSPTLLNLKIVINLKIKKINSKQITKLDIIEKIKNETGNEVYPSFLPKLFLNQKIDLFPLGGISNVTTVFCKESKEFSIYQSDRYGFNNSDDEWNSKEIFWYLIGDSYTQGSCVKQNENFASQIKYLDKKNVISLGMAGSGPLIELASLKEYSKVFKPKKILWFYSERNDQSDLNYEKSNPILMNYLKEDFSQNLYSKQKEIDKKIKNYIEFIKKNITKNNFLNKDKEENFHAFKKIIRLKIIRDKTSLDRGLKFDIDPLFKEIIATANNFVNKYDGKLYFVYLPDKERYSANKKDNKYLKKTQVINMIKDLNIPIIDIDADLLRKHNDPLSFYAQRVYGHYSPKGYSEIARFILDEVNKLNKK